MTCVSVGALDFTDLVELFKMYEGFTAIQFESLFTLDCNNKGTRGHLANLSKPRFQKEVRKYFFSHRVIDRWNALAGNSEIGRS